MPDIHHQVHIEAPQERVFSALTHDDGLAGWWTDDTMVARNEVRLGFEGGKVIFRMRTTRVNPPELLEWECLGDQREWTGTKLSFVLRPTRDGGTTLKFAHIGWREETDYMADCKEAWPKVLERLKRYAESGKPDPFFTS